MRFSNRFSTYKFTILLKYITFELRCKGKHKCTFNLTYKPEHILESICRPPSNVLFAHLILNNQGLFNSDNFLSGRGVTRVNIFNKEARPLFVLPGKQLPSDVHWKNFISISFHIEWDMIVMTVFLPILNQMEFHSVQNRKENSVITIISHWMWKEMKI